MCEISNEEEEELVVAVLVEVEERLEGDDLEEALQAMLAVGESVSDCDEVEVLAQLIEEYITASLNAVDGNATNLPDTTTLMELLGVIGEKECDLPSDLFSSLLTVFSFFFIFRI